MAIKRANEIDVEYIEKMGWRWHKKNDWTSLCKEYVEGLWWRIPIDRVMECEYTKYKWCDKIRRKYDWRNIGKYDRKQQRNDMLDNNMIWHVGIRQRECGMINMIYIIP